MSNPLDATYGVWLVSLFLETLLYGMGLLQTWIYFAGRPTDAASVKWTVLVVLALETIQVIFFFRSSYSRFVEHFGEIQIFLIWADSLQLVAAYLSAFTVQIYFASRILKLTKSRGKFSFSAIGIYTILVLACVQILAGIAQTIRTYELRSFLKLADTKPITTLQAAASLACDLLITTYLCLFLKSQKGEITKTNSMMDMLIYDAINRGTLTAMSSGVTMVLFLTLPDTFWFFLGLAPSSKLYMNSMLATLNTRQRMRDKISSNDKGWNSIPMATIATSNTNTPKKIQGQASIAAVDFDTTSVDMNGKRHDFPANYA
ncbi:hypothetical protein DFH06DRAFT_1175788 [Mycena polygramma]|nr:hypothetical protein DFH06DRAFT_1175788 [Mycena polygramma]